MALVKYSRRPCGRDGVLCVRPLTVIYQSGDHDNLERYLEASLTSRLQEPRSYRQHLVCLEGLVARPEGLAEHHGRRYQGQHPLSHPKPATSDFPPDRRSVGESIAHVREWV